MVAQEQHDKTQVWENQSPADLKQGILAWMKVKSSANFEHRVEEGDSVIMTFLAHGVIDVVTTKPKGIRLGKHTLTADTLVEHLLAKQTTKPDSDSSKGKKGDLSRTAVEYALSRNVK